MTTFSDEEIAWIDGGSDRSPDVYFKAFDISDKQRGYIRYLRLVQTSNVGDHVKKKILNEFKSCARIAAIDTAAALVEGSVPHAEDAIHQNAAGKKP
jgi:hypothetical protein